MNRPSNVYPLHRGVAPRPLAPHEVDYLRRELAPIAAANELRRIRERKERLQQIVTVAALVVGYFALIAGFFMLGSGSL